MKTLTIVGNARCYHTMDWFRTVQAQSESRLKVEFLTDLIDSESHTVLVRPGDPIVNLINIDRLLFRRQSAIGSIWRNIVKLVVSPLQARRLKAYSHNHLGRTFHAHTMYYMFVCWLAGVRFIGTPQGSEILVRPRRSSLYRHLAIRSLRAADIVTVDSAAMQSEIRNLSGVEALLIQNGIDAPALEHRSAAAKRNQVVSLRGLTGLYRIDKIFEARESSQTKPPLTLIYPFWDDDYKAGLLDLMTPEDRDLGRLDRDSMYELLKSSVLAISVPRSDSSPRSVYEAIFAGAAVAATHESWYDNLPRCMKDRVFLVDVSQDNWMDQAMEFAKEVTEHPFEPDNDALERFDQKRSMQRAIEILYVGRSHPAGADRR